MILIIGYILQIISGLFGLGVFIGILIDWLGFLGYIVWPLFTPGVIIFPFIYWMVEGHLPGMYLFFWLIGVVGTGLVSIGSRERTI